MGVSLDREPIVVALAARIKALCPDFRDVQRRWREPTGVAAEEQPLAIVSIGSQRAEVRRGGPSIWTLTLPVSIYCRLPEGDITNAPTTQLNALTKAVEDALERQATEAPTGMSEPYSTNLGLSNVISCRLLDVETDEGVLTPQAVAILAIEVLAVPA